MRWVSWALTLAAVVAAGAASAQVGRLISVTVRAANGNAVANAVVCAGTASNRGAFDSEVTGRNGMATLNLPPEDIDIPVNGGGVRRGNNILVTASLAGRGAEAAVPSPVGIATLQLAASGGPTCPADARKAPVPGKFTVDLAALARYRAAVAARMPDGFGESPRLRLRPTGFRCFGAVGQNCGDVIPEVSTCNPLTRTCTINAGSWQHDECCADNPSGGTCDNPFEAVTQVAGAQICQGLWNLAALRLGTPLNWERRVDYQVLNTRGTVDHAAYCAPAGTLMPRDERAYCCSRRVRRPNDDERFNIGAAIAGVPGSRIDICM